jgi:hypothetical protein
MWTCTRCQRIFKKAEQPHSCKNIPFEEHFKNKTKAKELFDYLLKEIDEKVGKTKIISLPCCIHLFGNYDFLATLPKRNSLEVRIGLDRVLDSPILIQSVQTSANSYKNCFEVSSEKEIDNELISWIKESYFLKT